MIDERLEVVNQWFTGWVKKLPEDRKQQVLEVLDQIVYYLSNYYHQSERLKEIENQILIEARLFNPEIESITEMSKLSIEQLEYIEEKSKSKYSLYSLVEGGIAGMGHPFLLLFDLPAMLIINMKQVQAISSIYGFSLRSPIEQVISLKVLYAATLPKEQSRESLNWLYHQYVDQYDELALLQEDSMIIQAEWLETLAKQWMKALLLYGLNKGTKKSFSIVGIALGANLNYQFTKNVASFASEFYKGRYKHRLELEDDHESFRTQG